MKSSAKTTARRPKFDLTPISVDEALSNPALASIESTLRTLAGLGESSSNRSVRSTVIAPPETNKDQLESDPATVGSTDIPIGTSSIGDAHVSEADIGDIPIGTQLPSILQPTVIGSEVLVPDSEAGNAPAEIHNATHYVAAAVESDAAKSQIGKTHIGDTHIGDAPVGYTHTGASNLNYEESIISKDYHNRQPIGISSIGDKHTLDSPIDDSHVGGQVSTLPDLPESGLPENLRLSRPRFTLLATSPRTVLATDRKCGQQMMSKMVTPTANNSFIRLFGGLEDQRLPRLSSSR